MSDTVPFIAMAMLIAMSLGARQASRVAVKVSHQYVTATLAFGLLISLFVFS